ncbi:Cof-type HAD-IIB family hydrolase [Treponema sp.]|uniref:Cof-type HAD-IIB family hydrolase n=1 Tax=Treponema sp. TaxID=166 RepID=UPI0025FE5523|nr:Cof-type HAD-IIB family hydrolase [Treponema sp.]MCR5219078.1 Cof-type HAD-IIB family hydrolase [Treponema sp.]
MEKLNPKLIALDLDDTLLDKNTQIPEENVKALQQCAQKGIYVVLCSGRAEEGILPFVRKLDIAGSQAGRFLIAINGCSVFDLHLRQQIYKKTVDADVLLRADQLATENGLDTEVYSPDTIFYAKETKWTRLDVDLCHVKGEIIEDYKNFLKKGFPKMLIPGEPEKVAVLQDKLKAEFGDRAVIFTSKPFFLELLPPACGKGEAIEYLCSHLGFGIEEAMCFGDSMNDESMIRKCGYGVAMCNGLDYIKNIADYVTEDDNNSGGVGRFIQKYVL